VISAQHKFVRFSGLSEFSFPPFQNIFWHNSFHLSPRLTGLHPVKPNQHIGVIVRIR